MEDRRPLEGHSSGRQIPRFLETKGLQQQTKNALMNLYSFSFAERNADIFKITALVRHTLR